MYCDKKCGKQSEDHPGHRNRKRKFIGNRFSNENETEFASTSAKKLAGSDDLDAIVTPSHVFAIINFTLVFSSLSNILKYKTCNGDVTFGKKDEQGLGFQLAVKCKCGDSFIYSCEKIANKSYEINRRLVFVMRLLGIGIKGINTFLGLMDLGKKMSISTYYSTVDNIFVSACAVFNQVIKKAGCQEKEKNAADGNEENKLIVSGDGTWSKRGFSSLFGVVIVIGHYTSKILDVLVKSSFCKSCTINKQKLEETEYETWYSEHVQDCLANHKGSAGGMEVQGMLEIFARAEDLHGAKYKKYIGDGDTKTFEALSQQDEEVENKECVNHVQKRMGLRLRNAKKMDQNLGGRGVGKLTDRLINKLTIYYGLAIRRNPNDVDKMINDMWATFEHKISTNEKPMHERCPSGPASWCKWRQAEAAGTLSSYNHRPPLDSKVQEVIRTIYEDLSSHDLLIRCRGGFTQNNNESFNKTIWQFAPKHVFSDSNIIQIAAFLATCIFNEGFKPILKIMETMGITIGPYADLFASNRDAERIKDAERRTFYHSVEQRMARSNENLNTRRNFEETEGLLYGPGIAD
ncbi:PREDICTED: uncharacterized protein LOC105569367 [Vollenhovia emeryi]|uniref:uncharacterized protein LOC105569367 n=1 Tax=Vollenhovia emeryi TaxID=411798 RepID=UPI0005F3A1CF|nr:PREDICTED: uncharacterized protein LOC105569367 [Vollenhovia emeryi]